MTKKERDEFAGTKLILIALKLDYRAGRLSDWGDYEGQPASEVKWIMRRSIRRAIRALRGVVSVRQIRGVGYGGRPRLGLPRIYYTGEGRPPLHLSPNVEDALIHLRRVFEADGGHGVIASKAAWAPPPVRCGGVDGWDKFADDLREFYKLFTERLILRDQKT